MNADKLADRAINILRHIQRKGPMAVFYIGDIFRTAKATGELAERAFESKPNSLVGIYDASCREEWLEEDMSYMIDLSKKKTA